jgi:dihydroxyacetone kinase-like predicted kinase
MEPKINHQYLSAYRDADIMALAEEGYGNLQKVSIEAMREQEYQSNERKDEEESF